MIGQTVVKKHKKSIERIHVQQLKNGVYLLRCETENGLSASKKIVIEH